MAQSAPAIDADSEDFYEATRFAQAGRWVDARDHCERVLNRNPNRLDVYGYLLHVIGRSDGPKAALDCYLNRCARLEPVPQEAEASLGGAWGNAAWQALRTGDPAHLQLADDLSERAMRAQPDLPAIVATRGAVMMATSRRDEGYPLITGAVRKIPDPVDRSEFCRFLATDAKANGDLAMSVEFDALADHLLKTA